VDALIRWQLASRPGVLPPYDEALLQRELELFPALVSEATPGCHARRPDARHAGQAGFALIVANNLSWPACLCTATSCPQPDDARPPPVPPRRLGVLDFQDAVHGPITYDIASLMRDAFLSWDEDFVPRCHHPLLAEGTRRPDCR
jgi:aminoglycoside/choline kinase family phosphotransferase